MWHASECHLTAQTHNTGIESGMRKWVVDCQYNLALQHIYDELIYVCRPCEMDDVKLVPYQKQQKQKIGPEGFQLPELAACVYDIELVYVYDTRIFLELRISLCCLKHTRMRIYLANIVCRTFHEAWRNFHYVCYVRQLLRTIQIRQVSIRKLYFSYISYFHTITFYLSFHARQSLKVFLNISTRSW